MNESPPKGQWTAGQPEERWTDKSVDGLWTYVVPGTNRGGVLVIKSGVVVGGNGILYFQGVVLPLSDGRISMTTHAVRFNHDASLDESWATNQDSQSVRFEGRRVGQEFIGTVTRHDTDQTFEIVLTRRGPAF